MPIQLTNPFNPGDVDAGKTYAQAKVVGVNVNVLGNSMRIDCSPGNTTEAVWVSGVIGFKTLIIEGQAFGAIMGAIPVDETLHYAIVSRIYQWLLDEGIYVGTIVP
jgi:hypothetical protein